MAEARRYRIVYRNGDFVRSLGRIAAVAPTRNTLDPFLSRLWGEGVRTGEFLLVDEATGFVVLRRAVRTPRNRRS